MMSGSGSIPNMTIIPPPIVGNELPPEYIVDQGLDYPAADNYPYCYAGYDSPGEWGDHHNVYGLDGQDLHYMGLQAGSLPYVYYTGYGYAQTPFNQYSPYVPGAVTGIDGSYVGLQHYLNMPSYQPSISSPGYIPIMVQPSSDYIPTSSIDHFSAGPGASVATRPANAVSKVPIPRASASAASSSHIATVATPFVMSDASQPSQKNQAAAKPAEGLKISIPQMNQSFSQETLMHGSGTHGYQGTAGQMQSAFQFSHGRVPFVPRHLKVASPSESELPTHVPSVLGWVPQDKQRLVPQFTEVANGAGRNLEVLGEQNKGPRKNRSKDQSTSPGYQSAQQIQSGNGAFGGCIEICSDQYNKNDFAVDYPDVKFFVIKSFSEDDVHKSVKYNVWSSTHNGNRRLDYAYAESQRKSLGKPRKCPVFLFFSVNASGQFCGLAEMVGPVDFDKDMNFWQQDKWSGSFPVKWHIIKDVPNASLRHIVLENNENKPVTNSRDTQEIPHSAGISMLKIFKSSPLRTSILDDFKFYELRQKKMLEDKFRHLGGMYETSLYVPAFVSPHRPDAKAEHQPSGVDENQPSGTGQISQAVDHPADKISELSLKFKEKMQDDSVSRPLKIDGKHSVPLVDHSLRKNGKQLNVAVELPMQIDGKRSTISQDLLPRADGMQPSTVVQPLKMEATLKPKANNPPISNEKTSITVKNQLPKTETGLTNPEIPPKVDEKHTKWRVSQPQSSNGSTGRPRDVNGESKAGFAEDQSKKNVPATESSPKKDSRPKFSANGEDKPGTLSAEPKQDTGQSIGTMELGVVPTDFVKVGSMQIKVKDLGESSSRHLRVGALPIEPPKLIKKVTSADSSQTKK